MQKGHALVAEELLIESLDGTPPTITELADRAGVNKSTASRTVAQLAAQGLVMRKQGLRQVPVVVTDLDGLAQLLAERTAWPGHEVVSGYACGHNIWDTASALSRNAVNAGIEIAVTGRTGWMPQRPMQRPPFMSRPGYPSPMLTSALPCSRHQTPTLPSSPAIQGTFAEWLGITR